MHLVTERLVLRAFTEEDQSAAYAPLGDVGDVPLQPFDLRDDAGVRRLVRLALANAREEPRLSVDLAIVRRADGRLIGHGGYRLDEREPRNALVWFQSDPSTWNQGLVLEAAQALLGHCFGPVGLHRVTGECSPKNLGARRLMERLGMRAEGSFVENAWHEGAWVDTAVYAMLAREWRARHQPGA